jgi:hypothetical protein
VSVDNDAPLAGADFEALLAKLATLVAAATGKSFTEVDQRVLRDNVLGAVMIYRGIKLGIEDSHHYTLDQIAPLATSAIELLKNEANRAPALVALGSPELLVMDPEMWKLNAERRLGLLVGLLDRLARNVLLPPPKAAHRPVKTKDLRALVENLVDFWERETRQRFTQQWHKGSPLTLSTRFVHDVLEFIDRERIRELPEVTKNVVAERRVHARSSKSSAAQAKGA